MTTTMQSSSNDYSIVPIALVDATKGNTDIVVHQSYVFSGQLSFEKLEDSWNSLVDAWPIIWARIRRDSDSPSGLSYHIPSPHRLDQIRAESKSAHDPKKIPFLCVDRGEQSFSSYFPGFQQQGTTKEEIFTTLAPNNAEFDKVAKSNSPAVFEEYLQGEYPLITIQITRFSDATIITRSNSHVYGDGFTMATVLRAWQDILDGKGSPESLLDIGYDPFAQFEPKPKPLIPWKADHQSSPLPPPGWFVLNWKQKLELIGRFLYDLYITRPENTMQQRYVFLPSQEIARLQEESKHDLASKEDSEHPQDIRIGKSDVLYAWLLKQTHATLPDSCISTPLSIINLKGRPPPGIRLPRHNFFCSALPVPLESISVQEINNLPLGELALHVRKSHQRYLDPDVQIASLAFHLHHVLWKKPSGQVPFFCLPHHRWSGLSDLRALRYFQLDFSGAIDGKEKEMGSAKLIAQHVNMTCAMSKRDRWICLGDSEDGTWFTGFLSKAQWEDSRGFGKYQQRGVY